MVSAYAGRSGSLSTNGEEYPAQPAGANRSAGQLPSDRFQLFRVKSTRMPRRR
jgi:hypothetical protein